MGAGYGEEPVAMMTFRARSWPTSSSFWATYPTKAIQRMDCSSRAISPRWTCLREQQP
jgi:hypothetical protein